jgi:hypothetical protein
VVVFEEGVDKGSDNEDTKEASPFPMDIEDFKRRVCMPLFKEQVCQRPEVMTAPDSNKFIV